MAGRISDRDVRSGQYRNIAAALAGSDAGPPAWDIHLTRKDLALMVSEGKKLGTSLPLTEKTLAICDEVAGNG